MDPTQSRQIFSDNFIVMSAAGALIIVALTVGFLAYRDWQISKTSPDEQNRMPFSAKFLLIVLGGVVFVWMVDSIFSNTSQGTGFATVAGLILLGVAAVIGIMNLLSVSAARIGIIDGRQPFGLPEGSVRAILTMAFIVLVGVLSSFLLTGNQSRSPFHTLGMETARVAARPQADALALELRKIYVADAVVEVRTIVAADKTETFALIIHPKIDFTVADDIAKQTLTMISTILAAMIGFYFAARGGGEGADPAVSKRAKAQLDLADMVSKSAVGAELAEQRVRLENLKTAIKKSGDANERRHLTEMLVAPAAALQQFTDQLAGVKAIAENKDATFADIEAAKALLGELSEKLGRSAGTLTTLKQQIDP